MLLHQPEKRVRNDRAANRTGTDSNRNNFRADVGIQRQHNDPYLYLLLQVGMFYLLAYMVTRWREQRRNWVQLSGNYCYFLLYCRVG